MRTGPTTRSEGKGKGKGKGKWVYDDNALSEDDEYTPESDDISSTDTDDHDDQGVVSNIDNIDNLMGADFQQSILAMAHDIARQGSTDDNNMGSGSGSTDDGKMSKIESKYHEVKNADLYKIIDLFCTLHPETKYLMKFADSKSEINMCQGYTKNDTRCHKRAKSGFYMCCTHVKKDDVSAGMDILMRKIIKSKSKSKSKSN